MVSKEKKIFGLETASDKVSKDHKGHIDIGDMPERPQPNFSSPYIFICECVHWNIAYISKLKEALLLGK